jgi:AcrR family transcriptional regulator
MRGRTPARPLGDIADAAVRVFTAKGYRPSGISDVAAALGLSHGAVYTYADSKHALLYLALLQALDPETVGTLDLPVKAPGPEGIVALLDQWAARQQNFGQLTRACTGSAEADTALELGGIVDELYEFIDANRGILTLFARCAADLPELAQWYFIERRRQMLALLAAFLRARIEAGTLRPVPDVPVAARFVVETIAWFAMHRHGDPDTPRFVDADCRRTVRHLVLAAFVPNAPNAPNTPAPESD